MIDATSARLANKIGGDFAASLLADHGEASRTTTARAIEWNAFAEYRRSTGDLDVATGDDMVCFIGWLAEQRIRGHRKVSSNSIPQYLSAVRTMHGKLGLPRPPSPTEYAPLQSVMDAYRRWESDKFPISDVRIGLSAATVRTFWSKGMEDQAVFSVIRDAALIVFSFIFGLRESSVLEVKMDDIFELDDGKMEVMIRKLKGRTENEAVKRGPRVYECPFPFDGDKPLAIITKYVSLRGASSTYLFPSSGGSGWINGRLRHLLQCVSVQPPPGCNFSSHSMRLGSLTERILLGGSVTELLALYDWKFSSQGMFSVYFDRRITVSSASHWFFGSRLPRQI